MTISLHKIKNIIRRFLSTAPSTFSASIMSVSIIKNRKKVKFSLSTLEAPKTLRADSIALGNPHQQRYMVYHDFTTCGTDGDTHPNCLLHYQELFSAEVGFEQIALLRSLTEVS